MKPRRKRWQKPLDEQTRELLEAGHRVWRTALNHESMKHSIETGKYKQRWTSAEDEAVMRLDVPIPQIAKAIGRTRYACQVRRWKLRAKTLPK